MSVLARLNERFLAKFMDFENLKLDLEYITQVRALPEGEGLAKVLRRLDAFSQKPGLPERLEHYLSKRSYVKALAWIENPDTPHHS